MSPLRFETVRDVFEAFPIAQHELNIEPNDEAPLQFLNGLTDRGELDKAVGFCAFLLPRREAVWWACRAVKTLIPDRAADEEEAVGLAEEWVREPEEERRVAALRFGMHRSSRQPTTWLALAAGWSGGSMNPESDIATPIQPHQTARAVRAAVLIAGCRVDMAVKPELFRRCIADGIRIATADERDT